VVGKSFVGCSGWSYRDWRGTFYDQKLTAKAWFSFYARHFRTVEINNTFYRMPPETTFRAWQEQAPAGFVYAVKVNRFGTHRLKLAQPERWAELHAQRAVLLGEALGPNLVQLPPNWHRDLGRLEAFLAKARELSSPLRPLRWAVEFRDPSWLCDATFDLLSEYEVALCCHDLLADHPWELTAPWGYARFHGPDARTRKYVGDYGEAALRGPAAVLARWVSAGNDVFAYFNNDTGGAAPRDAERLEHLLKSG
jgi:uncharacterized protein YecE (DUF72 family)